jgi:hypothetical protein
MDDNIHTDDVGGINVIVTEKREAGFYQQTAEARYGSGNGNGDDTI